MTLRVAIVGAGSIGCYLGGVLLMAGGCVRFHGRPRLATELEQFGLRISDYRGLNYHVPPVALDYRCGLDALDEVTTVFVTVKCSDTEAVGQALAQQLKPDAVVVSLQNGVGNGDILRACLPNHTVLAGMVSFNVLQQGQGRFHAGTQGNITIEDAPLSRELAPLFGVSGTLYQTSDNMSGVLWSKLLLNLNNPINALANIPLKEQLKQRSYRRSLAILQEEALRALALSNIDLPRLNALPPRWIPRVLRLPSVLFRLIAQRMLAIDPLARSSMWEDLQRGRSTEIDALSGEVLRLAQRVGTAAPANRKIVALIKEAESSKGLQYGGAELLGLLRS